MKVLRQDCIRRHNEASDVCTDRWNSVSFAIKKRREREREREREKKQEQNPSTTLPKDKTKAEKSVECRGAVMEDGRSERAWCHGNQEGSTFQKEPGIEVKSEWKFPGGATC